MEVGAISFAYDILILQQIAKTIHIMYLFIHMSMRILLSKRTKCSIELTAVCMETP